MLRMKPLWRPWFSSFSHSARRSSFTPFHFVPSRLSVTVRPPERERPWCSEAWACDSFIALSKFNNKYNYPPCRCKLISLCSNSLRSHFSFQVPHHKSPPPSTSRVSWVYCFPQIALKSFSFAPRSCEKEPLWPECCEAFNEAAVPRSDRLKCLLTHNQTNKHTPHLCRRK